MGKGNRPAMPLPARVENKKTGGGDIKKGCNSPMGCLIGQDPPIDCSRNPDYVKVICDNEKCTRNQYLHQECYDQWESKIILGVQKAQARTRDWTDEQVRRQMWGRVWDVAYRHCKCVCGGYLKPAAVLELPQPQPEPGQAAAADGGPKNEPKKKKQPKPAALPKLNQSSKNVYSNKSVSTWTAAGGSTYNAGAAAASRNNYQSLNNSMESLAVTEVPELKISDYIPGLFLEKERKKEQRRQSTSSMEDPHAGDTFKRVTYTPPILSSPSPALIEETSDIEWQVAGKKKSKSESPASPKDKEVKKFFKFQNDNGDGPSSSTSGLTSTITIDDGCGLEDHLLLSNPETPYIYGRDLFEIKCLLEEMNECLKPQNN